MEQDGQKLVIDPGVFSKLPEDLTNVAAVIVTHEHADHFDGPNLDRILAASPGAKLFAPAEVAGQRQGAGIPKIQTSYRAGPFSLEFFGEQHAIIHPSYPYPHNLSVLINDSVYFPGDSFTLPEREVKTLLLPANAPWAKVSETMDFFAALKPARAFPVHDALLSEAGQLVYDAWLQRAAEKADASYRRLAIGESINI